MSYFSESRIFSTGKLIPVLCASFVLALAIFALYNRQQDYWFLNFRLTHAIPIQVGTGIAFILSAFALALNTLSLSSRIAKAVVRYAAAVIGLLVALYGLMALEQYLSVLDLGLEWLFVSLFNVDLGYLNNVDPLISLCFLIVGLSFILIDYRTSDGHYPSEYLTLVVIGVMGIPLMGHLYFLMSFDGSDSGKLMAPFIAILFFLLAFGLLYARPTHRLMCLWTNTLPGRSLLRHLLPSSLLLLVILDLVTKWGLKNGFYSTAKASPILLLLSGALLFILFCRTAAILNREYEERRLGEAALAKSNALLRAVSDNTPDAIFVKDTNGRMVFANPAKLRLLGKTAEQVIGFCNSDIYKDHSDAARINLEDNSVLESGTARVFETTTRFDTGVRTLHSTKAPWLNDAGEVVGLVGISTDMTDRKRMEDALKAHETQLEELVAARTSEVSELIGHLETTREEEKRAIARELHDDLGSALTALNMHLSLVFQQIPNDQKVVERVGKIKVLLESITTATRRIQAGLRPDKLDVFGIKVAIAEQAAEFEKYSAVKCNASLPDEDVHYASHVDIALFRMVQEALNNIAKHAQASRVDIVLDDTDDEINLTIRDDGIGIQTEQPGAVMTHGLRGMRERAGYLGGSVRVNSTAGKGTSILVMIPKRAENMKAPEED